MFMTYKFLIEKLLSWDKNDYPIKLFLKSIFVDNWWVYLVCYQMLDPDSIFPSSFEYTFYVANCLV
jgi:hypothetical protein